MAADRRLGDFLRARRQRLQPEDVGLAGGPGPRRVVGLRRDEVAVLAGVSTHYYLRLEQGRDAHPSAQVLDALARALRLDPVATDHLHALARPPDRAAGPAEGESVHNSTVWLIESWPLTAAVVHSRYVDVLASNALARALHPGFQVGVNSVLSLFVDPSEREFHADWDGLAARSVALLRALAESRADDARLEALVARGSASSALFRELWERHDVVRVADGVHVLHHPLVGELALNYLRLPLAGTDGQSIFLYFAQPGSPSAAAMEVLAGSGWDQQGQDGRPPEV
jgi:transcriptional regulator with XRE-family HTH domain